MTCKQHSVAASAGVPTEEKRTRPFSTIACGFENVQRAALENCSHVFSVPTALRVKDKNYQKLYQSLLLRCSPCPGAAYATMRYLHTCKYSEEPCCVCWDSFCSIVAVSCPRSENWLKPAAASSVSTWHSAMFVEFLCPMNCWANTHEPRPYIPWLSWPAGLRSLFWPLPSLTRASLRPLALLITTYYDKSELRCSDWKEIQRCPLPLAVRLVTSWPRDGSDVSWSQRVALKRLQVWAGEDMSSDLRTLVDCPFQSNPRVL